MLRSHFFLFFFILNSSLNGLNVLKYVMVQNETITILKKFDPCIKILI